MAPSTPTPTPARPLEAASPQPPPEKGAVAGVALPPQPLDDVPEQGAARAALGATKLAVQTGAQHADVVIDEARRKAEKLYSQRCHSLRNSNTFAGEAADPARKPARSRGSAPTHDEALATVLERLISLEARPSPLLHHHTLSPPRKSNACMSIYVHAHACTHMHICIHICICMCVGNVPRTLPARWKGDASARRPFVASRRSASTVASLRSRRNLGLRRASMPLPHQ